jgi:hypothetical protein
MIETAQSKITMPLERVRPRTVVDKPTRPWLQDLWLWILLVGPLTAPLFVVVGWPILQPFAEGIYMLGRAVCPKVMMHLTFLGEPMAVCSSCWAAVWGLWVVRLVHGRAGEGFGPFAKLNLMPYWLGWRDAPITAKLSVLLAGFMPWALDVMLWDTGTWSSPHAFMMLVGFLGGLSAGSILFPAAADMRERIARRDRARRLGRLRVSPSDAWSR